MWFACVTDIKQQHICSIHQLERAQPFVNVMSLASSAAYSYF